MLASTGRHHECHTALVQMFTSHGVASSTDDARRAYLGRTRTETHPSERRRRRRRRRSGTDVGAYNTNVRGESRGTSSVDDARVHFAWSRVIDGRRPSRLPGPNTHGDTPVRTTTTTTTTTIWNGRRRVQHEPHPSERRRRRRRRRSGTVVGAFNTNVRGESRGTSSVDDARDDVDDDDDDELAVDGSSQETSPSVGVVGRRDARDKTFDPLSSLRSGVEMVEGAS